jgi:DNA-binding XRE family transcriptional regulator
MTADVKIEELIKKLREMFDCSQKAIAQLICVAEHTITNNKEKPLCELRADTREKVQLLYNTAARIRHRGVRGHELMELLEAQVHEDYRGNMESVATAIAQLRYNADVIDHIADLAYSQYETQQDKKYEYIQTGT